MPAHSPRPRLPRVVDAVARARACARVRHRPAPRRWQVMDSFETSFEDMDVRSEYVEQAMNSSTTAAMPEEQVDELMQMVADEHGLKMQDVFATPIAAGAVGNVGAEKAAPLAAAGAGGGGAEPLSASAEDDLEERLRRLRS